MIARISRRDSDQRSSPSAAREKTARVLSSPAHTSDELASSEFLLKSNGNVSSKCLFAPEYLNLKSNVRRERSRSSRLPTTAALGGVPVATDPTPRSLDVSELHRRQLVLA